MRVGIYLPYTRNPLTRIALRVADVLTDHGFDVSLRSSRPVQAVDPAYDARVQPTGRSPFYVWLKTLDYLFFPGEPDPDAVEAARPLRPGLKVVAGCVPTAYASQADLADRLLGPRPDRVVAYTQEAEAVLTGPYRCPNVLYAPPIPAYPFLRRAAPRTPPRAAVLLTAPHPKYVHPDCEALMGLPGAGLFYRRRLMTADRYEPVRRGRVMGYDLRYAFGPSLRHTLSLYDVAVSTSLTDPTGLMALEALAAGLPVVAHNTSPFSELVDHGDSGRLVACARPKTAAGFCWPVPTPGHLHLAVTELLAAPDRLAHLVARAGAGLEDFRRRAVHCWLRAFDFPD